MSEWLIAALLATSLMTPPMAEAQAAYDSQLRLEALAEAQCGPVGGVHECKVPEPVRSRAVRVRQKQAHPVPASVEHWRPLVEQHFAPADVPWAMRVMACESGGNPNAYNPSSASGLFQIKTFWTAEFPGDLFDPAHNVATAAAIYYTYGRHHWVCK